MNPQSPRQLMLHKEWAAILDQLVALEKLITIPEIQMFWRAHSLIAHSYLAQAYGKIDVNLSGDDVYYRDAPYAE